MVKVLLLVDLVVLIAAVSIYVLVRDDEESNVVNDGLRGSRPPAGQSWPGLDAIAGITPRIPGRTAVRGSASMLVATCLDCPSGDIIGGFLGRLGEDDLPSGARIVVLGWDGDPDAWRSRWKLDERVEQHHATTAEAVSDVRELLGIGPVAGAEESGIAYLHDTRARWRGTYFVGQLDREDVVHDLEALNRD